MTTATTIEGDMTTGGHGVGFWLPLLDAAAAYGVSERTMRRRVSDGEVPHRLRHGRREVLVPASCQTATDTATTDGRPGGDRLAGSAATALAAIQSIEGGLAGVLAMLAEEIRADRHVIIEQAQTDLRRVRRHAGMAWGLAACLAALGAAGGVLGVVSVRQADQRAEGIEQALTAAQTRQADLAGVVEAMEARARVEAARADTTATDLAAARLRVLEAELARVRAELRAEGLAGLVPSPLKISE